MAHGQNKSMVFSVTLVACLLLNSQLALSFPTFINIQWGLGVSVLKQTCKQGDALVFKYDKTKDNVVITTKNGYDSCTVLDISPIYTGGYSIIAVPQGTSYYISGIPGQCARGVKLAITAS